MAQSAPVPKPGRIGTLASIAVVIAALYFAKEVLIPIALAIMLSFLLTPLLLRLQRWGLPRIPALIVVIVVLIGGIGGIGAVVYSQVQDVAGKLGQYRQNIDEKVAWFRGMTKGGLVDKIKKELDEPAATKPVAPAATAPATQPSATPANTTVTTTTIERSGPASLIRDLTDAPAVGGGAKRDPVPVVITSDRLADSGIGAAVKDMYQSAAPFLDPLATAGIVIIFVIFMLLAREDLRDRVIRLIGQGRINVTTQAMDDAGQRVSRFLIAQCIVNGTYGLAVGLGLWIIGLTAGHNAPSFPNWFLWGALTGLLRFIPYLGPWIGASFPIVLSLAVYHGMTVPICVVGMFLLIELISNNVMEPWLYGASTGVSTVAILVAAVFWTWLWGMPGLLLSTPLTVLIAVAGKYVPQLEFLNILLGDEPALEPKYRFYQRLLADDTEEADELLAEYLQKKAVVEVYDEVVLPAMSLAEGDWHRDRLDQSKQSMIRQSIRDMVEEIGDKPRKITDVKAESDRAEQNAKDAADGKGYERCVLCIPARDPADEIAAMMMTQMLEHQGYCSEYVSVERLASEYVELVEKKNVQVVIISALPPAAVTHARYIVKRLRARFPDIKIIVGLWTMGEQLPRAKQRLESAGTTLVVGSLATAIDQLRQTVAPLILAETAVTGPAQREVSAAAQ